MKENLVDNKSIASGQKVSKITIKETLKEISFVTFPTILFFFCLNLQQTITLAFVGNKYKGQENL